MNESFTLLVEQLRAEALASRHQPAFELVRLHQPVLARYTSFASVLDALADMREATYPEREALTRALLAECQDSTSPAWTSALVAAYSPMLSRLRRRIFGDVLPREDLDQAVLTSFLSIVMKFPLARWRDWTAARLRQLTAREVFRFLRKEAAEKHETYSHEQLAELLPDTRAMLPLESSRSFSPRRSFVRRDAVLVHLAQATLPRSDVDVLVATVVRREKLRAYVGRLVEGDAATVERTYQRLKRQRSRLLQRLRAQADDVATQPSGGC